MSHKLDTQKKSDFAFFFFMCDFDSTNDQILLQTIPNDERF